MIGAVIICICIYTLFQIAFIGVMPVDHVKNGWHQIAENVPGGPFAAFATILGLQWLAVALYIDAVVSPSGTGFAYTGATARINYAMAKNRQIPGFFSKLNRFNMPVWSLLFNFAVGMIIFLPFPGWYDLVGFISASIVLSFAFGPISLAALRYQKPNIQRPFRLPYGIVFSAVSFVLVGLVVYWTGWETNWKVMLTFLIGILIFIITRKSGNNDSEPLNFRPSIWIWPYILGIGLISYLGSYGKGKGLLNELEAMMIIAVLSLVIFVLAIKVRLPDDEAKKLLDKQN